MNRKKLPRTHAGKAGAGELVRSVFLRVRIFTAAVAGCTVAAAAFAIPAALLGDPDDGQCKQHDQHDQGDDST